MKKSIIILTSIIMLCVLLVGCQAPEANITTSKELNRNLNLLSNTIRRLDTVENVHLVNSDLYSLDKINYTTPSPTTGTKNVLANSFNVILQSESNEDTISKISLKDDIKDALEDEIISRIYCDENGNCKLCTNKYICDDNNMCSSCEQTIICDSNGNCTYCNETLILDENNNCNSCNENCVSNTCNTNISDNTKSLLKKISNHNKELDVEFLSTNSNANDKVVDNFNSQIVNSSLYNDNNTLEINTEEHNNTLSENNDILNENNNISYNNNLDLSNNTSDNALEIDSLEDANTTTENITVEENNINSSDIISEDNFDSSENTEVSDSIDNINNEDANKYQIIYFSEEIFSPEYLKYNPRFIQRINYTTANESLSNYVEKVQKLYAMTADVVEANNTLANYKLMVLDDIDETRQLNDCIISGNCKPTEFQRIALDNYIADLTDSINNLRKCNGALSNQINRIANINTGTNHSIDVTNSAYLRILNQIDTRINYHENTIATLEQIKYILEDAKNNSNSNIVIDQNSDIYTDNNSNYEINTDTDNSNLNSSDNNIVNNTNDNSLIDNNNNNSNNENINNNVNSFENDTTSNTNSTDTIVNDSETIEDNNVNSDTENLEEPNTDESDTDSNNENSTSNIDSYSQTTYSNLELSNDNNETVETELENNNNSIDNENNSVINNNNINPTNNSSVVNSSDNIVSNNDAILNNGNNTNNHPNTIISQNNLNNQNIGNNSYRYDDDGNLYNNTNGYNSSELTNINQKNNNVNTYKYNSLVDSINRGTIANGINNL